MPEFVPAGGGVGRGDDGRELNPSIAACNARPEVTFEEFEDRVVVSVVANLPGRDTDDCADDEVIVLDKANTR